MSDIQRTLESAIVSRLNASAFVRADATEVAAVQAVGQGETRLLELLNGAMDALGVSVMVLTPGLQPLSAVMLRAVCGVRIREAVAINRDAGGSKILGSELGVQCWAKLQAWQPGTEWSPVIIQPEGFDQIDADEDTITWLLAFRTETRYYSQ